MIAVDREHRNSDVDIGVFIIDVIKDPIAHD